MIAWGDARSAEPQVPVRTSIPALRGRHLEPERRAALREYTEAPVRQGTIEPPWARLVAGLVLGSEAFARGLRQKVRGNAREQPTLGKLAGRISWERRALEQTKGESWGQFAQRHGDWGRDAALWLGRKRGRYRLGELGQLLLKVGFHSGRDV